MSYKLKQPNQIIFWIWLLRVTFSIRQCRISGFDPRTSSHIALASVRLNLLILIRQALFDKHLPEKLAQADYHGPTNSPDLATELKVPEKLAELRRSN